RYLDLDHVTYKRLEHMILLLDDDGYLPGNIILELAADFRCPTDEIEDILLILQRLDPPGVGARNLKECLLIQVNQPGDGNGLAKEIIMDYLPLLAERNWDVLASELSASRE